MRSHYSQLSPLLSVPQFLPPSFLLLSLPCTCDQDVSAIPAPELLVAMLSAMMAVDLPFEVSPF